MPENTSAAECYLTCAIHGKWPVIRLSYCLDYPGGELHVVCDTRQIVTYANSTSYKVRPVNAHQAVEDDSRVPPAKHLLGG